MISGGVDVSDIQSLVPRDKLDNSGIETLKTINADEIEPILGQLLEWIQDINWPVAQELFHVLPRFHIKLVPHIKAVLNSHDDIWKCWVLCLIKELPAETVVLFLPEIKRVSEQPTTGEVEKGASKYAAEVVEMFGF